VTEPAIGTRLLRRTLSGWPDIVLGVVLVFLNGAAAKEVWEVAEEERLAAKTPAGEEVDEPRDPA
jgi:hypothetical protein